MISRDVAIVLTLVALVNLFGGVGSRTFRPSIYGKIATATFVCTGVVTLYFQLPRAALGDRDRLRLVPSLAITVISAFHYGLQVVKLGH